MFDWPLARVVAAGAAEVTATAVIVTPVATKAELASTTAARVQIDLMTDPSRRSPCMSQELILLNVVAVNRMLIVQIGLVNESDDPLCMSSRGSAAAGGER